MLFDVIEGLAQSDGLAVATVDADASWRRLSQWMLAARDQAAEFEERKVGCVMSRGPASVALLGGLDAVRAEAVLIEPTTAARAARQLCDQLDLAAIVTLNVDNDAPELSVLARGGGAAAKQAGGVTILTSGTTGQPKAVRHNWQSLFRPARRRRGGDVPIWMTPYQPFLYAGLQVLTQSAVEGGGIMMVQSSESPEAIVGAMQLHRVRFATGTPSFWRRLLLFAPHDLLREIDLQLISLGGENADQHVLDALRRHFPNARIIHIFATTELGRCFSVTDGHAGFPARFLKHPSPDGVELKIENGELIVRSANRMIGYDARVSAGRHGLRSDGWIATGDLVKVTGDRVHFIGRSTEMINVGGTKVSPLEVENFLLRVDGVASARVYPKKSTIAGQLVACEIVLESGFEAEDVRRAIQRQCMEGLQNHQRPRFIDFVDELLVSDAGKLIRRPS